MTARQNNIARWSSIAGIIIVTCTVIGIGWSVVARPVVRAEAEAALDAKLTPHCVKQDQAFSELNTKFDQVIQMQQDTRERMARIEGKLSR